MSVTSSRPPSAAWASAMAVSPRFFRIGLSTNDATRAITTMATRTMMRTVMGAPGGWVAADGRRRSRAAVGPQAVIGPPGPDLEPAHRAAAPWRLPPPASIGARRGEPHRTPGEAVAPPSYRDAMDIALATLVGAVVG